MQVLATQWNTPDIINLLSEQSNQLALLTGESGSIGKTLKNVIIICDVVLLKDAFSRIFHKINTNVKIQYFHSSYTLLATDLKCVADTGLIVFICQKTRSIEKFMNVIDDRHRALVVCSELPESYLLNSKIRGFISLESDVNSLCSSFIKVLKNETVCVGFDKSQDNINDTLTESLTPRQLEVFACIRNGKCNKEIARDLGISLSTVKVHCMEIFRKLGVTNRMQAALL